MRLCPKVSRVRGGASGVRAFRRQPGDGRQRSFAVPRNWSPCWRSIVECTFSGNFYNGTTTERPVAGLTRRQGDRCNDRLNPSCQFWFIPPNRSHRKHRYGLHSAASSSAFTGHQFIGLGGSSSCNSLSAARSKGGISSRTIGNSIRVSIPKY